MKYSVTFLSCLFVAFIGIRATLAQDKLIKWTGDWVINVDKSNFGNLTPEEAAAKEIKILLKKDSIVTIRVLSSSTAKETYNYNGKPLVQKLANETTKTSSFSWLEKGVRFMISSTYEVANSGNPWQYVRSETYTLSNDGKLLTLDRVTVIPDRTDVVKAVYNKKIQIESQNQ